MKNIVLFGAILIFSSVKARNDSLASKPRHLQFGILTSASYQFAVNGTSATTNLGNSGFKGYLQPSIGLAVKYQSDSTEFACISLSAARLSYTLGSKNVLSDSGNSYDIINRFDVFMNNYSIYTSYSRRLAQFNPYNSLFVEAGIGLHYIQEQSTLRYDDSLVGPYSVQTSLITEKKNYFLPSASTGLNLLLRSAEDKAQFIIGVNAALFLDELSEVKYTATYTKANSTVGFDFRWAPLVMMPKVSVGVLF